MDSDQDMDSRLRRLRIGGPPNHGMPTTMINQRHPHDMRRTEYRVQPSQTGWFDGLAYGRLGGQRDESPTNSRRTEQRVQRSQTGWFDGLAYGRRQQDESPAGSPGPQGSSSDSDTPRWYHSLLHDHDTSFTSENRQVGQRNSERNMENQDNEMRLGNDGDTEQESQRARGSSSSNRTRSRLGSRDDRQETIEEDLDLPGDTRHGNFHQMNLNSVLVPDITRGLSNDAIEVVVQRLDSLEQSCLRAVHEGADRIANSIAQLQGNIGPPQTHNNRLAPSTGSRKVKLTHHPVRRSNEARERQKNIRDHLARLLAQAHPAVINEADARAFQLRWDLDNAISCCTIEKFCVDLNGPPRSAWNQSASQIFAESYCNFFEIPIQMQQEVLANVAEGFLQKIKALKHKQKTQSLNNSEKMKLAKMHRKRTRKRTLFYRRLDAAEQHPHLLRHIEILQRLGVDGMSSDESDYEELQTNPPAAICAPRYYVLRPKWRHDDLSDWLETFDVVYNIMRRESLGRRGAYARRRVQNSTVATLSKSNSFVPCLPANAYDQVWLSGRRDIRFSVIPMDNYDFTHDSAVFRYMQGTVLES